SHSSAVIDLFSRDPDSQLHHVTHDGDKAIVRLVESYSQKADILNDLDIRASDLLQANSIVWVEGPSHPLYFTPWVELWTHGQVKEQIHYQCLWYGGASLAGMSFEDPEEEQVLLAALRVNRNAIVLMDRDRESAEKPLKDRVIRIREEVNSIGGISWVT